MTSQQTLFFCKNHQLFLIASEVIHVKQKHKKKLDKLKAGSTQIQQDFMTAEVDCDWLPVETEVPVLDFVETGPFISLKWKSLSIF